MRTQLIGRESQIAKTGLHSSASRIRDCEGRATSRRWNAIRGAPTASHSSPVENASTSPTTSRG